MRGRRDVEGAWFKSKSLNVIDGLRRITSSCTLPRASSVALMFLLALNWCGVLAGLLSGIGFAAASSLSYRLFGGDGFKVCAIQVGGDVGGLTGVQWGDLTTQNAA